MGLNCYIQQIMMLHVSLNNNLVDGMQACHLGCLTAVMFACRVHILNHDKNCHDMA